MPVVLMYHSINPATHPQSISPTLFETQLKFLQKNQYIFLKASELVEFSAGSIPPKCVCITFDDGFEDNYKYAVPLLIKYNAKATFFVATNFIGRDSFLNGFRGMSASMIRELSSNRLFEIASHGCSHQKMTSLTEEEVVEELKKSKSILNEITGKNICAFAFPYGDYAKNQLELVKMAGFRIAFSTKRRRLPHNFTALIFTLPRLGINIFTAKYFPHFFKAGYELFWRLFDEVYMELKIKL